MVRRAESEEYAIPHRRNTEIVVGPFLMPLDNLLHDRGLAAIVVWPLAGSRPTV
jgi:hypothetical protein